MHLNAGIFAKNPLFSVAVQFENNKMYDKFKRIQLRGLSVLLSELSVRRHFNAEDAEEDAEVAERII